MRWSCVSANLTKLAAVGLLAGLQAFSANAAQVTVTAQGSGSDYEEARTSVLRDAIMQVTGVTLDAKTMQQISSLTQGDKEQTYVYEESQFNEKVREILKGYIRSFSILNQTKTADGVELQAKVTVEKYEIAGLDDNRRTVSVQAFKARPGACFGKTISAEDLTEAVTEALQTAFVNTRKFSVLDRHSDAYRLEKEFLETNKDVRDVEKIRIGHNRGSDFVITGDVRNVRITESSRKSAINGKVLKTRAAHADVVFNVMLFATRQIQYSSSVTINLVNNLVGKDCRQISDELIRAAATKVAAEAAQAIFPPLVLNYDGQDIIFNYGGNDVRVGEYFNLYRTGEVIYDPYTKESLGRKEKFLGKVRVVDVKPKFSIARFVNGGNAEARNGDILRPISKSLATAATKKSAAPKKPDLDDEW